MHDIDLGHALTVISVIILFGVVGYYISYVFRTATPVRVIATLAGIGMGGYLALTAF